MVTPNGTNVDFVGTNYTGEATTGQSCNFALGVLDKATQTLKILPVASNKVSWDYKFLLGWFRSC